MTVLENALPTAEQAAASGQPEASEETKALNAAIDAEPGANESEQKPEPEKKEKTPEQREIERLRRGIDRKTRQLAETRAQLGLTQQPPRSENRAPADDSEPLSLTRAQLREMVTAEAQKLAPTLKQQDAEAERRRGIVDGLANTLGRQPAIESARFANRFDELADQLNTAFDGLADSRGVPKPAFDAVFEADDPAKVIEYLADPEHDEEAESISRMGPVQAGKAIAKLEYKIQQEAAKAKPRASKAAAPLEALKGQGPVSKELKDLSYEEFVARRREQIRNRR